MKSAALASCIALLALSDCKSESKPAAPEMAKPPLVTPTAPAIPEATAPAVNATTLASQLAALYPIVGGGGDGMASFNRPWTRVVRNDAADGLTYTFEVCLRKRAGNIEYVAVCQSTDDGGHPTPGLIDVHAFDVSSPEVRVMDSKRDITSNGFGHPQEPEWLQIGPSTYAVVILSGYTSTGETISEQNWVVLRDGKLISELSMPDYHAYEPGCDADDAQCNTHSQSCKPELLKTKPVDAWGRWPLLIRATSQFREEPETTRSMLLKSNAKGYVFTTDDAIKLQCIDG